MPSTGSAAIETPDQTPYADVNTGVSDQSHNVIAFPSGDTLALPKSMHSDLQNSIAQKFHELTSQAGQAVGAASESLGGPSSISDIPGYAQRSKQAISHPLDSLKQVSKSLVNFSDPAYLDAAHQAYSEGRPVEAATHVTNWLLGPIGKGNEQITQDLKDKSYSRAIGHTAAALLPILFSGGEAAVPMTEADAAAQASKAATINPATNRPASVALNVPDRSFNLTNTEKAIVAGKPKSSPVAEPTAPYTEAERIAAKTIRMQYRGESNPVVEENVPVQANVVPGDATHQEITDFIDRAYGKSAKPEVEQIHASGEFVPGTVNIGGKTQNIRGVSPEQTAQQAANEDALTRAYISRLEKDAKPDDVTALNLLKQKLGITKPSAESLQTMSSDTPEQIRAYAEAVKKNFATKEPIPTPRYMRTEEDNQINHTVEQRLPDGTVQGRIKATEFPEQPNVWHVDSADMGSNAGKGLGTKAYTELANRAAAQGAELRSGGVPSKSASAVWRKLKAAGFNVQETEGVHGTSFSIPAKSESTSAPVTFMERTRQSVENRMAELGQERHINFGAVPDVRPVNRPMTPSSAARMAGESFISKTQKAVENRLNENLPTSDWK
jgi:hypothetical protein